MRKEAKRWLSEGLWDLEIAEIFSKRGGIIQLLSMPHQVAEKTCKALLYRINEAPWGHSVRVLLERYFRKTRKPHLMS